MTTKEIARNLLQKINFSNDYSLQQYDINEIKDVIHKHFGETLYKYAAFDKNRMLSLENDQVFGNTPSNFNDPLDSFIHTQVEHFFNERIRCLPLKSSSNETLFERHNQLETYHFNNKTLDLLQKLRITCFSNNKPTDYDSYLMWSHYADNHRGICLEYNTEDILNLMNSNEFILNNDNPEYLMLPCFYHGRKDFESIESLGLKGLFYKHDAWSYEKELRLIFKRINGNVSVKLKPKTIYAGCKIPENEKQFIESICQNRNINFESGSITQTTFGYARS